MLSTSAFHMDAPAITGPCDYLARVATKISAIGVVLQHWLVNARIVESAESSHKTIMFVRSNAATYSPPLSPSPQESHKRERNHDPTLGRPSKSHTQVPTFDSHLSITPTTCRVISCTIWMILRNVNGTPLEHSQELTARRVKGPRRIMDRRWYNGCATVGEVERAWNKKGLAQATLLT